MMVGRVDGKVALVTGAGSSGGLGQAIARRLAAEGALVYLTDIDRGGVRERANEIGKNARAMVHDVTSEPRWAEIIDQIVAENGRIDILINNAAISVPCLIEDLTLEGFKKEMDINMTGAYIGTRAAVAAMRKSGSGGAIVNLSSVAALVGFATISAYAASKAALRLFGKSIAMETARDRIRINSVHPGPIRTQMTAHQDEKETASRVPMGRIGEPVEVANCVLFLASDEASYITGAEFVVDGGMTAT